jgi:GTPase involved in cell partitioning and DNA repair
LTQKVSWIVCNKIDLMQESEVEAISKSIQEKLGINKEDIFFISAATGEGTKEILQSLEEVIAKEREELS